MYENLHHAIYSVLAHIKTLNSYCQDIKIGQKRALFFLASRHFFPVYGADKLRGKRGEREERKREEKEKYSKREEFTLEKVFVALPDESYQGRLVSFFYSFHLPLL